jgi:hypothetical protein
MVILLAGSNAPLPLEHAFMPPFARRRGEFRQRVFRQRHGESHRGGYRQSAEGTAVVTRRMVSHVSFRGQSGHFLEASDVR